MGLVSRQQASLGDRQTWLAAFVLSSGLICSTGPGSAQMLDQYFQPMAVELGGVPADQSRGRELSRYEAGGVRVGSFVIRPDVAESFGFNSNVDGFSGGRGSSFTDTTASLKANSDWSRNSLSLGLSVDDRRYLDVPRQSFTTWSAVVSGTLDVARDKIGASYQHQNLIQLPGSLDAVTVLQPVPFTIDTVTLNYHATSFGRFTFVPEISVANYNYNNYSGGGVTVSQSYRNRLVLQGSLTTRYEFAPQRDALLVVRGASLDYTGRSIKGEPKRNANGGAVLAGLDYPAPGSNFRFRVLAGMQFREYQSSAYANLATPIGEASVIWTPTRLTTVTLSARRDIEDASDDTIAGYTYTAARLNVDHELRRNITLNGYAELLQANYPSSSMFTGAQGIPEAGTSQTIYNFGVGASWLLNRNIRAAASFGISDHTGSRASNYLSSISMLTLGIRL